MINLFGQIISFVLFFFSFHKISQDCQSEANRLRLLERQRQLIETKLQRRQLNQQNENIIIPSSPSSLLQINSSTTSTTTTTTTAITTRTIRPATSIGNLRFVNKIKYKFPVIINLINRVFFLHIT